MPNKNDQRILPHEFMGCGHGQYGRTIFSSVRSDCESCSQFYCVVCHTEGEHCCSFCGEGVFHGEPENHYCPSGEATATMIAQDYEARFARARERQLERQGRIERERAALVEAMQRQSTSLRSASQSTRRLGGAAAQSLNSSWAQAIRYFAPAEPIEADPETVDPTPAHRGVNYASGGIVSGGSIGYVRVDPARPISTNAPSTADLNAAIQMHSLSLNDFNYGA